MGAVVGPHTHLGVYVVKFGHQTPLVGGAGGGGTVPARVGVAGG